MKYICGNVLKSINKILQKYFCDNPFFRQVTKIYLQILEKQLQKNPFLDG